jgi:hypothetical protein
MFLWRTAVRATRRNISRGLRAWLCQALERLGRDRLVFACEPALRAPRPASGAPSGTFGHGDFPFNDLLFNGGISGKNFHQTLFTADATVGVREPSPISTAPCDGTLIWLHCRSEAEPIIGYWSKTKARTVPAVHLSS